MPDSDHEIQMPSADHNEREAAASRKRAIQSETEPLNFDDKRLCVTVGNDVSTNQEDRDKDQIDDPSPHEKSSTGASESDHEIVDENFSEDEFGLKIEHIDADECAFLYQVLHVRCFVP
jgi:hypothetical protein